MNSFTCTLLLLLFITSIKCTFPSATKEWEYLTIIGTVDGNVHGVNEYFRKVWTTSTGDIMLSGSTTKKNHDNSDTTIATTVIPALDGTLLYHNQLGMRKTSVKARMMIENSPVIGKDGVILTGKKSCRLLGLDLSDGSLLADISPHRENKLLLSSKANEKTGLKLPKKTPFWLGRIDYLIQGTDSLTGIDQFNVSYAELQPINTHLNGGIESESNDIDLLYTDRESPVAAMENLSLISTPDGAIYFTDRNGKLIREVPISLGSPAMHAYIVRLESDEPRFVKKVDINYSVNDIKLLHRIKPQIRQKSIISNKGQMKDNDGSSNTATREPVILVQSSKVSTDQSDFLFAMELEMSEDSSDIKSTDVLGSTLIQSIRSRMEQTDNQLKLPAPQYSSFDSNKNMDSRKLGNNHLHLPLSISKGVVRRPPNGYALSKWGRKSSLISAIQNTSENPSKMIAISNTQPVHHVSKIRGLHRLKFGEINEDFWLEQISTEITSKAKDLLSSSNNMKSEINNNGLVMVTPVIKAVIELWTGLLLFIFILILLTVFFLLLFVWFVRKYQFHILPPGSFANQIWFCIETILNIIKINYFETAEPVKPFEESGSVDGNTRVGALSISDKILGFGSHGTIVYQGLLNGRPVAVKRMLAQFNRAAEREISMLIKSDGHPNVVRYFLKEQRNDFVYLGLQLCDMSLKDFVNEVRSKFDRNILVNCCIADETRMSLQQVTEGLSFLHSQKIVHRDIKPHNILCSSNQDGRIKVQEVLVTNLTDISKFMLKISDMGLSKQLDQQDQSFSSISMSFDKHNFHKERTGEAAMGNHTKEGIHGEEPVGTIGWQAPELVSARKNGNYLHQPQKDADEILYGISSKEEHDSLRVRRTLTVDIFSLACVFYYVLSVGDHPYGQWYERESNILSNKLDLSSLLWQQDAIDLLSWMLNPDPLLRPTCNQVRGHPFFWVASKRLEFLVEFSDRLEKEPSDSPIVLALESNSSIVLQGRWDRHLDPKLMEDIGKYRKYDVNSVRDLLRLIRNKKHHFHELPEDLKSTLNPMPSGFCWYFESKFPLLLLHCGYVANRFIKNEGLFEPWLRDFHVSYMSSMPLPETIKLSESLDLKPLQSVDLPLEISSQFTEPLVVPSVPIVNVAAEIIDEKLRDVIVWQNSSLETTLNAKGWWRDGESWASAPVCSGLGKQKKGKPSHLLKASTDFKYRTRLCTHWEGTGGDQCPMRKKGKCIFAHGPVELRVKETRRDRWAKNPATNLNTNDNTRYSGGEDVLGAARSIEKVRALEGSFGELERSVGTIPPPPELVIHPTFYNSHSMPPAYPHNHEFYSVPPPYYGPQDSEVYNYDKK